MKWLFLIIGIVVGAVSTFALVIYAESQRQKRPEDIIFALKNYYDSAKTVRDGYIAISGTLTGDGIGYPNNTNSISCELEKRECSVASVEQIGKNHVGRMETPRTYPIVRWNAQEVVAASEASSIDCNKVTITIDRRTEALLWVQEPLNHTSPRCKDADTRTYKWSIEDAPAWKRMRAAK
jgi:hypothetical protein